MKKLLFPLVLVCWVLMWALAPISSSVGQNEAEAPGDLFIENIQHPKRSVNVERGRKVKVILKDERTYKGILLAAGDSTMRVDSVDFAYKDIRMVRVPGFGNVGAKVSGLVVGLIGFVGFAIGLIMILMGVTANEPDNTSEGCGQAVAIILLIFFGVVIGTVGAAIFLIGLITFLVGVLVGKAFKLDGKWKLSRSKAK